MSESGSPQRSRWTFSLSSMLMLLTIGCLVAVLILTNRRLASTESQLRSLQPLAVKEVAAQFEKRTTLGPIATTVQDVRYSPDEDAYKVRFSWTNREDGQTWSTSVVLKSDGYGTYYGVIRNGPFIDPLGHQNGFTVAVETPSPLQP